MALRPELSCNLAQWSRLAHTHLRRAVVDFLKSRKAEQLCEEKQDGSDSDSAKDYQRTPDRFWVFDHIIGTSAEGTASHRSQSPCA